jgi:hypothetical protein
MPLAALLTLWWPKAPAEPVPDLLLAVDEPGATVVVERRLTDRSKRIVVTTWSSAVVMVNGEPR